MEENLRKDKILSAFETVIPYLPYLYDDEISVALTDREKFIVNTPSKSLKINSIPGERIPEGGAAAKTIQSGKATVREVPKEVYGAPFRSYAVPIKGEKGEVVGAILVARNLERSMSLLSLSQHLSAAFEQITSAINELSEDIQNLGMVNREILNLSETAVKYTEGTQEILGFVQKIASQSNLLGINAAIEAARAGEMGRGFQVVAQEIRKMSVNTSDSTKKINNVLNNIGESIVCISDRMKESNDIFHGHMAILEEITASMAELNNEVKLLEELSKKI